MRVPVCGAAHNLVSKIGLEPAPPKAAESICSSAAPAQRDGGGAAASRSVALLCRRAASYCPRLRQSVWRAPPATLCDAGAVVACVCVHVRSHLGVLSTDRPDVAAAACVRGLSAMYRRAPWWVTSSDVVVVRRWAARVCRERCVAVLAPRATVRRHRFCGCGRSTRVRCVRHRRANRGRCDNFTMVCAVGAHVHGAACAHSVVACSIAAGDGSLWGALSSSGAPFGRRGGRLLLKPRQGATA